MTSAPPVLEEFILILRVQFDGRLIPLFSFCLSPNVRANEPRHWLAGYVGDCGVGMWELAPAMKDFAFKVNLVAVVRVRADDESVARKVVPTVLGAPGTADIRLANENNAAKGHHATVTDVDFSIGSVKPLKAGSR